ncbi:MAG: acyl-CoA thioesterase [Polyangiales bacterium]
MRYAESDQMGIAHHASYVLWLEAARIEWLRHLGFCYRDMEAQGVLLPVTGLQIHYRAPARFDDVLQVPTELHELGHCRIVLGSQISRHRPDRGAVSIADAVVTLATVDAQGRPRRLPKHIHTALSAMLRS